MKYFVVMLKYLVPMEKINEVVGRHREFLDQGYERGWFLASGPQNPKVGGLIIARAPSQADLEKFLANDPFQKESIASATMTEFEPVKRHGEMGLYFEG